MKRALVFFFVLALCWPAWVWAQSLRTVPERVAYCQNECANATKFETCVKQCQDRLLKEYGVPKVKHKKKKKASDE